MLIYGLQAAGLYASIAIPMGLILGIVHIVNLAHGEFMMVAAYLTYMICAATGMDPFVAMVPVAAVTALFGFVIYKLTIRQALKAPELNQLILTFGLAILLTQMVEPAVHLADAQAVLRLRIRVRGHRRAFLRRLQFRVRRDSRR